jgi:hypothetical protein
MHPTRIAVGREGETPMAPDSAIRSFTFDVDELGWTGHDLQRPG